MNRRRPSTKAGPLAGPAFPFEVVHRNGRAKIYRSVKRVAGRPYIRFRLSLYGQDGRRTLVDFADFQEAVEAAKQRLEAQGRGLVAVETLTGSEFAEYRAAVAALTEGSALGEAVKVYAEARRMLGTGSVLEAVKDYARRFPATMPRVTVPEAVEGFLEAKRKDQLSTRHLEDLRLCCERFVRSFNGGLLAITGPQLREWFEAQHIGPRSWNNLRSSLGIFFRFAVRRGWLPRDWHELAARSGTPVFLDEAKRDGCIASPMGQ